MTESLRPTPSEIRAYRAENPKMRERDIAAQLGVSEAALVAAECGLTAVRIDADANRFLLRAEELGEVMALTRNESAVHEKIGVYEKITTGEHGQHRAWRADRPARLPERLGACLCRNQDR